MEAWKSRKLIGAAILICAATAIIFFDVVTSDKFREWGSFVQVIFGTYVVGNAAAKFAGKPTE